MAHSEIPDDALAGDTMTDQPGEAGEERPPLRRQPPLAAWFAGLGIRTRIATGFAAALALLLIVAVAAGFGIRRGETAFTTYDAIAESDRLVQQFERDLIDLRRNLLLFVERDNPRGLLATRRLEPSLRETLAAAIAAERDAQRKAELEQITPMLERVFASLGQAITARNRLKEIGGSQLDVYGPRARESLIQLIRSTIRGNNFISAAEAGLVLDAFSEIRLAATRFVGQGEMAMANEARGKVAVFVDMIEDLKSQFDDEALQKEAAEAEAFARQYEAGIVNAADAAGEMNRLVYQTMEDDFAQIATLVDQIKAAQVETLKSEQAAAATVFNATRHRAGDVGGGTGHRPAVRMADRPQHCQSDHGADRQHGPAGRRRLQRCRARHRTA